MADPAFSDTQSSHSLMGYGVFGRLSLVLLVMFCDTYFDRAQIFDQVE